jgi:hypothetical protein
MSEEARAREVRIERDRCPYCHAPVRPDDEKLACDGCMAWHHAECWRSHGTCAACGVAAPSRPAAPGPAAVAPRPAVVEKALEIVQPEARTPSHELESTATGQGWGLARARTRDGRVLLLVGVLNVGLFGWLLGLGMMIGDDALTAACALCAGLGAALALWGLRKLRPTP